MELKIKYTPDFVKEIKKLWKKYKNIDKDFNNLINLLDRNPYEWKDLWDWFYKIRIKNSDNNKGKSGWYRTITYYNEWDFLLLILKFKSVVSLNLSKK